MKVLIIPTIVLFAFQFLNPTCAQTEQKPKLVVQLGHSGAISSAIYSPDGRFIVSGGIDDNTAILWETSTGREIRRFVGHSNSIYSVAFSPDTRFVLTGSGDESYSSSKNQDNTARLWKISDGKEVMKFAGHTGKVTSVDFSADGKYVLTASEDKSARLWELKTGKELKRFDHEAPVDSADYSPDGQSVVTGSRNDVVLWNIKSGAIIRKLGTHEAFIKSVKFSADGRFVITSYEQTITVFPYDSDKEKKVRQWDVSSGQEIINFEGTSPGIISPDGRIVLTGGAGENMAGAALWNAATGDKIGQIAGHKSIYLEGIEDGVVIDAAFAPDAKTFLLVFGTDAIANAVEFAGENSVYVYDAVTHQKRFSLGRLLKNDLTFEKFNRKTNFPTTKRLLAFNSVWNTQTGSIQDFDETKNNTPADKIDGGVIQSLSKDGKLALGYTKPVKPATASKEDISGLGATWASLGRRSIDSMMASDGRIITLWDMDSGRILHKLGRGYTAHISPDSRFVLTESFAETNGQVETLGKGRIQLNLWEGATGKRVWSYEFKAYLSGVLIRSLNFEAQSLAGFTESMKFITVSEPDRKVIRLLDFSNGKPVAEINDTDANLREIGEKYILFQVTANTPSEENILQIHEIESQKVVGTIKLGKSEIYRGFLPDNNLFATTQPDKEKSQLLKIWNSSDGELSGQFVIPTNGRDYFENKIFFSEDNSILAVLVENEGYFYEVKTGKQIHKFAVPEYAAISSVTFSPDNRFILMNGSDGTGIFNAATGKFLCRITAFENGTWVVSTPDGRFDTNNLDSVSGLHWIDPLNPLSPFSIETFMRDYYQPKLLARVLNGEDFLPIRDLSALNRTQPKIEITEIKKTALPLTVEVTVEAEKAVSAFQKDASQKPLESGVFDVRLFRDRQLVGSSTSDGNLQKTFRTYSNFDDEIKIWRAAHRVELKGGKKTFSFRVKLPNDAAGKPIEFSAYAFNDDRVKSETSRKTFTLLKDDAVQPKPRHAYVITFGVNKYDNADWNLQFAGNDARAMRKIFSDRLRARKEFSEIIELPLVSDDETISGKTIERRDARKGNVKAILDLLSGKTVSAENLRELEKAVGTAALGKIKPAHPDDMILLSFSSHGYADRNGIFYVLPTDIGKNGAKKVTDELLRNSISSDELSLWLRDVDASEMVMIVDACHAASAVEGKDFKPAPMGSRGLGQLAFDKGMKILTATQAANAAIESGGSIGHGLLTYALLREGLENGQADFKAKDRSINLKEWLEYGETEVPRLYERLAKGELKGIGRSSELIDLSGGNKFQGLLQTPTLFDFTRKKREMILMQLQP